MQSFTMDTLKDRKARQLKEYFQFQCYRKAGIIEF